MHAFLKARLPSLRDMLSSDPNSDADSSGIGIQVGRSGTEINLNCESVHDMHAPCQRAVQLNM